ncbi:MAG: hypothetical protein GVX78_04330 [Bacteroidetes bacterium]|jgi:peptidyl-prolyl cis-trans isomerase SurA|nr:hypothetical protein [Bacteroidota bacterium]
MKKMYFQKFALFIIAFFPIGMIAQETVLFSVEDLKVTTDEFKYVFEKNNNSATSESDIKEYLDLYKKFKLKVKAAYDKKMDTLPHLNDELNTYRRQLSKNYLLDKQLQENVARETYNRKQQEVKIAHIAQTAETEEEEADAYERLSSLIPEAQNDFAKAAAKYSEDPGTRDDGGLIGYLSAPFAKGFEQVEDLAYTLEVGEVGGPVKSQMGVHLIKVLEKKPARGEMELSHIFVRKPKPNSPNEKKEKQRKIAKIEEAYQAIEKGTSFKHAALKFSEDDKTKYNKGYLGFIEPNTYEEQIEEKVFQLENEGDYTSPLSSSLGWHIFMRGKQRKPQDQTFQEARPEILSELKYTNRLDHAQNALIDKIKQEAPFDENSKWVSEFRSTLPPNFTRYDWKIPGHSEKVDTVFITT